MGCNRKIQDAKQEEGKGDHSIFLGVEGSWGCDMADNRAQDQSQGKRQVQDVKDRRSQDKYI